MEKRNAERTSTSFEAEIIYNNNSYAGIIENLSAAGANVLTAPLDPEVYFRPDDPIELIFKSFRGETVILKCTVIWSSKIPPKNLRSRIGAAVARHPSNNSYRYL